MCATLGNYQAKGEEVEAPAVTDAAEETPADAEVSDPPAAEESAANSLLGGSLLGKIFAAEEPEADVPAADGATAEEPGTDSDRPAGDAPAKEALTGEAATQEQPSSEEEEEEEEGNDIKPVQTNQSPDRPVAQEDNSWSLNSIRNSFQTVHGYFDSLVELVGGHDGMCQYRCRYGELPQPRPGYQHPEPDGCSSSLVGFQFDLGIPAMTKCCNELDVCYDTCGTSKYDCDSKFRLCLHDICSDLNKSLGFGSKVQACESMADTLFNTVWTLGCRPYMNSQRAACVCEGEERDEL
ncbi:group XIIB secretory phospholipase A2-like protein [Symphorus nematophorus]